MGRFMYFILGCCLLIYFPAKSQFYYYDNKHYNKDLLFETGLAAGLMNCITDLGGGKTNSKLFVSDLGLKNARFSGGIYLDLIYLDKLGLRFEMNFGEIAAADSLLRPVQSLTSGRYERNLSFKSRISDLQLAIEIYPLPFFDNNKKFLFSPYVVLGTGLFSFDPKAKLKDQWFSLQPLHTEGQGFNEFPGRKPYKLCQLNFSIGTGIKYEISSFFNTRLEFNYRFLTTDYLDDVSTTYIDPGLFDLYLPINQAVIARQLYNRKKANPSDQTINSGQRGNPGRYDAFFTILLKFGVTIGRRKR